MISASKFYGGAIYRSISATLTINHRFRRAWSIASTAGQNVDMPDARQAVAGTTIYLINVGSNTFTVRDSAGNTLGTVAAGAAAQCILAVAGTKAGVWALRSRALGTKSALLEFLDIFIIGGTGSATANTSLNSGGVWTTGTPSPRNHVEACAGRIGALGAVIGNFAIDAASDDLDLIDGSGSWVTGYLSDAIAVGRGMSASMAGKMYVFGSSGTVASVEFSRLASVAVEPQSIEKTRGTATAISKAWAILISGEPVSTPNCAYNRVGDFYETIANYSNPTRRSLASFAQNGIAYAVGGRRDSPTTRYDVVEAFDFLAKTWAPMTPIPIGSRYSGCGISGNARGYYAGGLDASDAAQTGVLSYVADTWTVEASLPGARSGIDNSGVAI